MSLAPKPARAPDQSRTGIIYAIAALIGRYRFEHDTTAGNWRVYDIERGERTPPTYQSEDMARAGCRLTAACDIHALFDRVKS